MRGEGCGMSRDSLVGEALELLVLFVDGELWVQIADQLAVTVYLQRGIGQLKRRRETGQVRSGNDRSC